MEQMYAILDVPHTYKADDNAALHRLFVSGSMNAVITELASMGATDDTNSVEQYNVFNGVEFESGFGLEPPDRFIERVERKRRRIFSVCQSEMSEYADADAFISDLALSSLWESDGKVPEERIEWLRQLWDAAHRSVKDICRDAGMTQRALAENFAIPLHTVNNWCMEIRTCPVYTRMMMQESLGLFNRQCPV